MAQERINHQAEGPSPRGPASAPCATSRPHRQDACATRRAGFTLIELVVVVALTSILLLLLLGPIGQALNLTSRGQALVAGQDNVRHAQARIYRELTQAMLVHLDRPVNVWQYSQYDPRFTDIPQPTDASIPQRYQINGACMDVILPLHVYYDPHPNDGSPPHHLIPGPPPQG